MKAMKLGMLITLISLALVDWFFGLHIEGHRLYWKRISLPLEIIAWPEDLILVWSVPVGGNFGQNVFLYFCLFQRLYYSSFD